jgi:hypothetical protein
VGDVIGSPKTIPPTRVVGVGALVILLLLFVGSPVTGADEAEDAAKKARLAEIRRKLLTGDFENTEEETRLRQEARRILGRKERTPRPPRPPEFAGSHESEIESLTGKIREFEAFLEQGGRLTLAQRMQLGEAKRRLGELRKRKEVWERYRELHPDDPGKPDVVPRAESLTLDLGKLLRLYKEFHRLDLRRRSGALPPTAADWEAFADRLEWIANYVRPNICDVEPRFVHRGLLLLGASRLFAFVEHHRQKRETARKRAYERGVEVLETLLTQPGSEGDTGFMPAEHPDVPPPVHEFVWPNIYGAPGMRGRGALALSTQAQARRMLAHFCPWGLAAYRLLHDEGFLKGLDWGIVPDIGAESIWEAALPEPPPHIVEDGKRIERGSLLVDRREIPIKWAYSPKQSVTVWVYSPRIHFLKVSEVVLWGDKTVKLLLSGPVALVLDEVKSRGVKFVAECMTTDKGAHFTAARLNDATKISYQKDLWLLPSTKFKPSVGPSGARVTKGLLKAVLSIVEQAEAKALFEAAQPDNTELNRAFGDATSFDGKALPPVMIRTDTVGLVVVPSYRYGKQLQVIRYFRFHPGALTEHGGYHLERQPNDLPKAPEYRLGNRDAIRRTWVLQPGKWGTSIHVLDFSPAAQRIRIEISEKVFEKWQRNLTKNQVLGLELLPSAAEQAAGGSDAHLPTMAVSKGPLDDSYSPFKKPVVAVFSSRRDVEFQLLDTRLMGHGSLPVEWDPIASPCTKVLLQELSTDYVVRVVRFAAGEGPTDMRGPNVEEKTRFVIRLQNRPGKPATGTLGTRSSGKLAFAELHYKFDESTAVAPLVTTSEPLLEPALFPWGGDLEEDATMDVGDDTLHLQATLSPSTAGWRRLTIRMGNAVYHAWDKVERDGTGALFKAALPAPPSGAPVDILLEARDAGQRLTFRFKVRRKGHQPPELDSEKVRGIREDIAEEADDAAKAKTFESRISHRLSWMDDMLRLAKEYEKAERYGESRTALLELLKKAPSEEVFKLPDEEGALRNLRHTKREAYDLLAEVAWRLGDRAAMGQGGPKWVDFEKQRLQTKATSDYKPTPSDYCHSAQRIAEMLERCVLLGLDTGPLNKIRAHHRWCLEKAGVYDERFDRTRYYYRTD